MNKTDMTVSTDPLFAHFQELYTSKNLPDCQSQFIKDGIIDLNSYPGRPIRILFIAKEHNYQKQHDYKKDHADYREWIKEVMLFRFAHRLGSGPTES